MEDGGTAPAHRAGFVALIGCPNAGKSTFLNRVLGQKIAIVSDKPQTTRTRILGIKTLPEAQLVLVDTPGIHEARDLLNRSMVAVAHQALLDADVVLWIVDAARGERGLAPQIVELVSKPGRTCCVALNKIDALAKPALLPLMARLGELLPGREIVPISARDGDNVDRLLEILVTLLPAGPSFYPDDEITDQTERSLAREIVREKVFEETRHEVPYATAVTLDAYEEHPDRRLVVIKATIHVDRDSQKGIVIGRGGARLKAIGQKARADIEALLDRRVFLELFVRVQEGWTSNPRRLKELLS